MPVAAWFSHYAGAECAGLNEVRAMPARGGARREERPRPVMTDQMVSRQVYTVAAVAAAWPTRLRKTSSCSQAHGYVSPAPDPGGSHPAFCEPRLTWRQFFQG